MSKPDRTTASSAFVGIGGALTTRQETVLSESKPKQFTENGVLKADQQKRKLESRMRIATMLFFVLALSISIFFVVRRLQERGVVDSDMERTVALFVGHSRINAGLTAAVVIANAVRPADVMPEAEYQALRAEGQQQADVLPDTIASVLANFPQTVRDTIDDLGLNEDDSARVETCKGGHSESTGVSEDVLRQECWAVVQGAYGNPVPTAEERNELLARATFFKVDTAAKTLPSFVNPVTGTMALRRQLPLNETSARVALTFKEALLLFRVLDYNGAIDASITSIAKQQGQDLRDMAKGDDAVAIVLLCISILFCVAFCFWFGVWRNVHSKLSFELSKSARRLEMRAQQGEIELQVDLTQGTEEGAEDSESSVSLSNSSSLGIDVADQAVRDKFRRRRFLVLVSIVVFASVVAALSVVVFLGSRVVNDAADDFSESNYSVARNSNYLYEFSLSLIQFTTMWLTGQVLNGADPNNHKQYILTLTLFPDYIGTTFNSTLEALTGDLRERVLPQEKRFRQLEQQLIQDIYVRSRDNLTAEIGDKYRVHVLEPSNGTMSNVSYQDWDEVYKTEYDQAIAPIVDYWSDTIHSDEVLDMESEMLEISRELIAVAELQRQETLDETLNSTLVVTVVASVVAVLLLLALVVVVISVRQFGETSALVFSMQFWTVERLLADEEACGLLRKQAQRQLSVENVDFLQHMNRLHIYVLGLRKGDARELVNKFIKEGSSHELNIAASLRRRIIETFDACCGEATDKNDALEDCDESLPALLLQCREVASDLIVTNVFQYLVEGDEFKQFELRRRQEMQAEFALLSQHMASVELSPTP
ncbi:MAG: hypothetical protein MHM6MM_000176 [Cercozoa sp. M6MM]